MNKSRRLEKVKYNPANRGMRVQCVACGKHLPIHEAWADLNGKAFEDYYCTDCAKKEGVT